MQDTQSQGDGREEAQKAKESGVSGRLRRFAAIWMGCYPADLPASAVLEASCCQRRWVVRREAGKTQEELGKFKGADLWEP